MSIYTPSDEHFGSSKRAEVTATYGELVELLGEPDRRNTDFPKVKAEFEATRGSDQVAVWDYYGEEEVELNERWSIWTNTVVAHERFLDELQKLRMKEILPDDMG